VKTKSEAEGRAARIEAAAKQLFLDKGYDGTTMQAIADASQVNKALLHYYFQSKDKLFLIIFREEMAELSESMSALWREGEKPFRERMEEWIDVQTAFLARSPRLHLFVINEMARHPDLIKELLAEFLPLTRSLLPAGRDATSRGKSLLKARIELAGTVYSLIFFPAVAAPMIQHLLGVESARMQELTAGQIKLAKELVRRSTV
jgi:TetR/AcrR family transcriptional regulator